MNFAPSLHLSKLLCEAVTDSLQQRDQTLSMQQLCAFLWGLTKVSHLQESAGSRGSGTRLSDVYGGSGRGWQKRKAAPTSAQVWQESIMPVVRAAQQPAARHIRTLHPDYARVRRRCGLLLLRPAASAAAAELSAVWSAEAVIPIRMLST